MSLTQGLHRAMQTAGGRIATRYQGRDRTWAEVGHRVARLAGGLRSLGVERGDRVAILSLNSDYYVEYFYAVAWAGAACNPVNIRLASAEIAYTLNDSGCKVLFIDKTFSALIPELRKLSPGVDHYIYMGDSDAPQGTTGYEALIAQSEPVEDAETTHSELAGLFYTGGTTGKSKGVMLTHGNLVHNAMNVIAAMGYDRDVVYLHAGPMFHLADMASTFAVTMVAATHCAVPRFDVEQVLQVMQGARVTHTLLVPTMVNLLVSSGRIPEYDLKSLRRMLYGASPMPEALLRKALSALPDVGFIQGYGQTEASPLITFLSAEDHRAGGELLRSAGMPGYGVDVRILDEKDRPVPRGAVGEICARGANVMLGYWGLESQTAETLRNGWLHTGDMGFMDHDGYVYIVDRAKDMVITGGENVFSIEVEGAIYQHPAVQECAVIGIPDERWGEAVHAIVVPKPGMVVSGDEIIAHCRSLIAAYKVPRSVVLRSEPMPLSGAGKVLKTELRNPYWKDMTRNVG